MRRASVVASAIAIWMLTVGVVVQSTPAEAGPNSFQYLDRFDSGTYNGNNGTDNFTGPWWENNDWGGTNNGLVTVESGGNCPTDRCAVISGDPFTFWGTGLYRWADTSGAEVVKIKFRYSVALQDTTNGYLNVGVFDGAAWNTVHTIWLNAHEDDDDVGTKTITVTQYAHEDFMVGFFAHDDWEATFHIDNVEVFGSWDSGATATTSTTTTTQPPSTTTQPSTTTTAAPSTTTTSTTNPPVTTTTSTTTTTAPTTTTSTTSTTVVPGTTTVAPTTTVAALPPVTTVPPTTVAIVPAVPIQDDVRYNEKLALISANDGGEIMSLPAPQEEIVSPGPVTQIMASITTTAVTVRSHLLSAMALGLLIAVAAIWGLGKRESIA